MRITRRQLRQLIRERFELADPVFVNDLRFEFPYMKLPIAPGSSKFYMIKNREMLEMWKELFMAKWPGTLMQKIPKTALMWRAVKR